MAPVEECPSCNMSLRLFTPRECERHVNECLDAGTPEKAPRPECAVCGKDLSPLTRAAQNEHANRCADSLLPKVPAPQRTAPRENPQYTNGVSILPQRSASKVDPKLKSLLDALGLARYAPKFASEEIDLDALRLLTDSDLSALRIPDAARRRIAEAMHSVTLLNRIAGDPSTDHSSSESKTAPAPATQQFQDSRVANGVRRRDTALVNLDSDGDDDDGLFGTYETATPGSPPNPTDTDRRLGTAAEKKISVGEEKVSRDSSETGLANNSSDGNSLENRGNVSRADECDGKSNMNYSVQICSPPIEIVSNEVSALPYRRENSADFFFEGNETICYTPEGGPRTVSELESWRMETVQKEMQRHKRKLESIEDEYRRLKRKLEESPAMNIQDFTEQKSCPVVTRSPIDLTLDETPGRKAAPFQTLNEKTPPSEDSAKRAAEKVGRLGNFQSQIIEDSGSSGLSSDEDFKTTTLSSRVANTLSQRNDTENLLENDEAPSGEHSHKNRNEINVLSVLQEASQSCDEVMDLTQAQPEQDASDRYVPNIDDVNTRERCSGVNCSGNATRAITFLATAATAPPSAAPPSNTLGSSAMGCIAASSAAEDTTRDASVGSQKHSGGICPKQSRLRRPKKVTMSDLRSAIRADPKLLDDILLMKSVDLERVMSSVKSFGLKVSRKALVEFMFAEGLPFKEAPDLNKKSERSKQYFAALCIEGFH